MMVLINVVVLTAICGAAVGIVWLAWALIAIPTSKRKWRAALWGLPFSVLVVLLVIGGFWWYASSPTKIFEQEFGFAPPPDTSVLNGYSFALGDCGSAYLHFHTTAATFSRLANGYQPSKNNWSTNESPPSWYVPPTGPSIQHVVSDSPSGRASFASEHRQLYFEPSTGEAWYSFLGID